MNKMQVLIVALVITFAVGLIAVLGYTGLVNRQRAAAPTVVPTVQAAPAPSQPAPVATSTGMAAATAASAEQAQSMAQATLQAGVTATAVARSKIDAIMRLMPVGDINLSAENAQLQLTIVRMLWLGPGSLAVKVRATNPGQGKVKLDLGALILEDAGNGLNPREEAVSKTLAGALESTELSPGASVEGQVAFKLPLLTAPTALVYNDGVIEALKIDIMAWIMRQPQPAPAK